MDKKLYRLDSKGKVRLWHIKVTDNVIETWDGILDGKLKPTRDVVSEGKNLGKSNATSPAEQALLDAQRKVTLKTRQGYQETIPNPDSTPVFDNAFFNSPPRNFVGPKPLNKMPEELQQQLESEQRLVYTRKWNGMCCHIIIDYDSNVRIFTSKMDEKTNIFPWQTEALKGAFGPGTWLMAEAVIDDDPDKMKTVFGALPERAIEEQKEMGIVEFHIFNMLFQGGEKIDWPWYQRIGFIDGQLLNSYNAKDYFDTVEVVAHDKDTAVQLIREGEWEGCVIWDINHSDMPIKWGGAPSRKCGAWKLKNFKEADVLIYDWETGKGKLNDDVATLLYGAYDSDGNIVHMGRGGSGLDENKRNEIRDAILPVVCELKYEEITKAGKFRLPVILRVRDDKPAKECTVEDIPK